jgi:hypothetical protein
MFDLNLSAKEVSTIQFPDSPPGILQVLEGNVSESSGSLVVEGNRYINVLDFSVSTTQFPEIVLSSVVREPFDEDGLVVLVGFGHPDHEEGDKSRC